MRTGITLEMGTLVQIFYSISSASVEGTLFLNRAQLKLKLKAASEWKRQKGTGTASAGRRHCLGSALLCKVTIQLHCCCVTVNSEPFERCRITLVWFMVVPIGAYKFGKNIGIGLKRNIPTCQIISSPLLALKARVVQWKTNQGVNFAFFRFMTICIDINSLKDNFIIQKYVVRQKSLQIRIFITIRNMESRIHSFLPILFWGWWGDAIWHLIQIKGLCFWNLRKYSIVSHTKIYF